MAFLNSVEKLREVRGWAKTYLWDIKFTSGGKGDLPPAPFSDWFPALDVEENIANLEAHTIPDAYLTSLKFPKNTSPRTLRITFIDDGNHTLLTWLDGWINREILNQRDYVATLEESVKLVQIVRLAPDTYNTSGSRATANVPIENNVSRLGIRNYWIFPEDSVTFIGNSSSDLVTYSITFNIAAVSGEFKDITTF